MADIKSQLADRSFFREPSSIPHPSVTMDPGPFVEDRLRTVESSIRRLNSVQEIEMPQLDSRFKQIEEQVSSLKKDSVSLKVAEVEAKLNLLGCSMQELSEFKDITQRQLHPMLKAQSQIEVEVPNLMARIETLETKGSTQNHKLSLTVQQVEAQIHEFGTSMLELKGLKELSEAEKIPVVSQPPANDPQLESRVKFLEAKIRIPRDDTVLLKVQEIENRLYELGTSVRDLEPLKDRISSQYQPANDIPSKDNSKLESRIQVLETRLVSQKDASDSLEVSEIEKRLHQLGSSVQELECFKEESEKKSRIAHSVQEAALSELPELNSRITFLEMQYKHTSALAQEFEELKRMTQNAGNVNSEKVSELAKRMEHLEIHLGKETDNLIIQKIEHLEHKLHLYAKSMQELEVFKNVGQTQLLSSQPSALETLMPIVQSLEAQIIKNKQDLDAKLMKLKTEEKTLGIDSTQIATLRQNVDDLATEIASLKKVEKTVSAIEGKLFASSEAQGALIREAIFKMNQERQHTRVDAISVIETVRDTITATHNSEMSDLSRQLALLSNSVTESRFAASKFDSHQVRIQSLEEQLAETKQKTTDRFAKLKPVEETVRSLLSKIERVSELEGLVLKLQKSLGSQSPATPEESRKNPELIQSQRDLNQCKDEISKSFASRFDKQNMMLSDLKREMSTVMEELEEVVKVRSELDDQKLLISDMNEQVKKAQTTFKSLSTFKDSVSEFAVMTTKVSALESEMVLSCQREATLSNEFHISLSQQKEEIKKFVNTKIESQNMIITALKQALSEIQEKMADEQSQGTTGSSVVTELQSRFATLEDTFTKIRDKTVVSLETEKTSDVITELGTECTELTKKIGALDKLVLDIEARTRSIKAVNDGSSNSLDAIGSFRVDVLAAAITEMKKVLDSDINPQLQEKDADIKNLYSRIAAVSEVREAEMNGNESEPSSLTPRTVVATLPEIRQEINLALNRHDKKSESLITTLIKDSLDIKLTEVDVKLEQKVNNDVLEELVKHLATREELKKLAKKKSGVTAVDIQTIESQLDKKIAGLNLSPESFGSNLNENMSPESKDLTDLAKKVKRDLKIYLQQNMEQLEAKIFKKMESQPSGVLAVDDNKPTRGQDAKARNELKTWVKGYTLKLLESRSKEIDEQMQKKQADLVEYVKRELKNVSGSKASEDLDDESSTVSQQGDELNFVARRLTREFDEKLFLLCSDLSACKESLSTHFAQPFYRCAQWIWKSGQLKMGSALPWNIQSLNTDPYNFVWEEDQVNIRVQDAGLYEITFAFFTKTKPSVQIVVNGESVLSSINSPSYVVHHSSGYVMDGHGRMEEGTVTGLSLIVSFRYKSHCNEGI